MSGFSFPPPPPPPKTSSSNNTNSQTGHAGRARGRGRGRGGQDDRGRGRGGRAGYSSDRRHQQQYSSKTGSLPINHSTSYSLPTGQDSYSPRQNGLAGISKQASAFNFPSGLPPGTYVNPAFQQQQQQPPSHLNSSLAAPSHHHSQPSNKDHSFNRVQSEPSRTIAGHKRKLEALRGPPQQTEKLTPTTAPSVPSFGSPIAPTKLSTSSSKYAPAHTQPAGAQKKRTLGLTPGRTDPQYSDSESEEDDADEEDVFAQLGTALKFEHNGEVFTIGSAADLAAWKKERSKQFPTKDRIAAKMDEKRHVGKERKRLLIQASEALQAARDRRLGSGPPSNSKNRVPVQSDQPESELERTRKALAEKTKNLEKLRRQVSASENRLRAAQAESDEKADLATNEEKAATESEAVQRESINGRGPSEEHVIADERNSSSVSEASSVVTLDSDDHDSNDSDGPPEETTSKAPIAKTTTKKLLCTYFAANGHCRLGGSCNFKYERPAGGVRIERPAIRGGDRYPKNQQLDDQVTTGRMSLHDRLVEQEQEQENRLAVQVIKYLGKLDLSAARTSEQE